MAFPFVVATRVSSSPVGAAHLVTMPTSPVAGQLLIICICINDGGGSNPATPSGWTAFAPKAGANAGLYIFGKVSDGTEGGTSVDVHTASVNFASGQLVYQIGGWFGNIAGMEVSVGATALSGAPNPDALNPSGWDVEDTLWLAVVSLNSNSLTGVAPPANYSTLITQNCGAAIQLQVDSSSRNNTVASEDPGTCGTTNSGWTAQTVGIRPDPTVYLSSLYPQSVM